MNEDKKFTVLNRDDVFLSLIFLTAFSELLKVEKDRKFFSSYN